MKAVSALQKKAAHPRQKKNNITKRLLTLTLNIHHDIDGRVPSLLPALGGK
jgi:hypothetical protein